MQMTFYWYDVFRTALPQLILMDVKTVGGEI